MCYVICWSSKFSELMFQINGVKFEILLSRTEILEGSICGFRDFFSNLPLGSRSREFWFRLALTEGFWEATSKILQLFKNKSFHTPFFLFTDFGKNCDHYKIQISLPLGIKIVNLIKWCMFKKKRFRIADFLSQRDFNILPSACFCKL